MKVKAIATATDMTNYGFLRFKESLDKYNWDYEILSDNYVAYGSKMKNAYEYAKRNDYTHLFILDAYDIVVTGTMEEAVERLDKEAVIFNSEKGCWPRTEWRDIYPVTTDWRFLNGGAAFVEVSRFIKMFDENPIVDTDNDQEVLGWIYLTRRDEYNMKLDTDCKVFQSIAFENEDDFSYYGKFYNLKTKTNPIIIHGNGKSDMTKVYNLSVLDSIKKNWKDITETHVSINEQFVQKVNETKELKELRDWVESHAWGFGERSFYWMWKLIVDEMPQEFTFVEIGVFRGQILALVKLLADMAGKKVKRIGITPLNTTGDYWESDYEKDIEVIHDTFNLKKDYTIVKELSTSEAAIQSIDIVDLLYIDGGHTYDVVKADIKNYAGCVNKGGFLVMDDCATAFDMPFGYFRGHEEVSKAVDEALPPYTQNPNFEHYFNVVHNRIWKKL